MNAVPWVDGRNLGSRLGSKQSLRAIIPLACKPLKRVEEDSQEHGLGILHSSSVEVLSNALYGTAPTRLQHILNIRFDINTGCLNIQTRWPRSAGPAP